MVQVVHRLSSWPGQRCWYRVGSIPLLALKFGIDDSRVVKALRAASSELGSSMYWNRGWLTEPRTIEGLLDLLELRNSSLIMMMVKAPKKAIARFKKSETKARHEYKKWCREAPIIVP